ncbi:hypothetical protein C2W62_33015 [Candidatus Entotheonella serta]|nr:hypothetical protein C2W62_33015 [Candidatus Entotheonella serta]
MYELPCLRYAPDGGKGARYRSVKRGGDEVDIILLIGDSDGNLSSPRWDFLRPSETANRWQQVASVCRLAMWRTIGITT